MYRIYRILIILPIFLLLFELHSGRTDANGGHYDHSTGEYHYHHGYSAHDHYDIDGDGKKDCPIEHRKAIVKEVAKAIAAIISYLAGLFVPMAVLIIILKHEKYISYSHSLKKALTQEIDNIVKSNRLLSKEVDSIHLNYCYIDETINKESEIQQSLWHIEIQYKEKTERLSSCIKILLSIGSICFFCFLSYILSRFVFKNLLWLAFAISIILSFIACVNAISCLSINHEKKDEVFKKEITLYAANETYKLYDNLLNSIADLHQFLGIPSDIVFIDKMPSDTSVEANLMPYGTFTRFVAPYAGKCFHQKKGCSGAFHPVNLYAVIGDYAPCSKCSYSDKNRSLPEWYQYYVKLNRIIDKKIN